MTPRRLQLQRMAGFRLHEHSRAANGLRAINVARPNVCGNPFPVDVYGQEGAVDRFKRFLDGNISTRDLAGSSRADRWADHGVSLVTVRAWICEALDKAPNTNLACFCKLCPEHQNGKPLGTECTDCQPCHADVALAYANRRKAA